MDHGSGSIVQDEATAHPTVFHLFLTAFWENSTSKQLHYPDFTPKSN